MYKYAGKQQDISDDYSRFSTSQQQLFAKAVYLRYPVLGSDSDTLLNIQKLNGLIKRTRIK